MKEIFKNIREFFWPLLEEPKKPEPTLQFLTEEDIKVDSDHLKETLNYTIKCFEDENERSKIIEGKSSLFIGTISVVTTVIIGITSVLINVTQIDGTIILLVFLLFALTLYMARTVWFSIKALERKSYHVMSDSDFIIEGKDDAYYKKLIIKYSTRTRKNSRSINKKVDAMTMAQEYFKRAISTVVLYMCTLFLYFIIKSADHLLGSLQVVCQQVKMAMPHDMNIIILYVISISSLVLSGVRLRRERKEV